MSEFALNFGLGDLPLLSSARTRSISAENPTGAVGGGATEVPDPAHPAGALGKGWKVRPCITLPKHSTTALADIAGPATITHIWITADPRSYRDCILRYYWDGEESPSVEVPLGDFFANGHALRCNVNSLPVAVNPSGGFNSYWPMPFRQRCQITIENQHWEDIEGFFYQVSYALAPVPEAAAYFHAQWRRSVTERREPQHTILEGIRGRGHYVGTYLAWTQLANGWWGEGEIKFFIDGDGEYPTICGTGTEDYFGGCYNWDVAGQYTPYSTPFLGMQVFRPDGAYRSQMRFSMYRWHVMDPIRFERDLRVTIQALGWRDGGRYLPLQDDIASVAFWYQTLPTAPFPRLPDRDYLEII